MHNAFALLASEGRTSDAKFVSSVVLFGDPDRNLPIDSVPAYKVSIDCHKGDDICENGENVLVPHVTYCHDVLAQALFVKSRSKQWR